MTRSNNLEFTRQKRILNYFFGNIKERDGTPAPITKDTHRFIEYVQCAIIGMPENDRSKLLEILADGFYEKALLEHKILRGGHFLSNQERQGVEFGKNPPSEEFKIHFKDCLIASLLHNFDTCEAHKFTEKRLFIELNKQLRTGTGKPAPFSSMFAITTNHILNYIRNLAKSSKIQDNDISSWETYWNKKGQQRLQTSLQNLLREHTPSFIARNNNYISAPFYLFGTLLLVSTLYHTANTLEKIFHSKNEAANLKHIESILEYILGTSLTYYIATRISLLPYTITGTKLNLIKQELDQLDINFKAAELKEPDNNETDSLPYLILTPYIDIGNNLKINIQVDNDLEEKEVKIKLKIKTRSVLERTQETILVEPTKTFKVLGQRPCLIKFNDDSFYNLLISEVPEDQQEKFKKAYAEKKYARFTGQAGFKQLTSGGLELKILGSAARILFTKDGVASKYIKHGLHIGNARKSLVMSRN